jgi:hypothetical protein
MMSSGSPPGRRAARPKPLRLLCLALLLGCAPKAPLHIGPGAPLEDLPRNYSVVLGRVEVWLGERPYLCATPGLSCGLSVTSETGQGFLIPYSPPTAHWLPGSSRSPFFVIRLPDGAYTVSHFQGPGPRTSRKAGAGSGLTPIDRRFRVEGREMVYIGSLRVHLAEDRRGKPSLRVVDERREAERVARELGGGETLALRTRLMR